jgi:hypothetical protein
LHGSHHLLWGEGDTVMVRGDQVGGRERSATNHPRLDHRQAADAFGVRGHESKGQAGRVSDQVKSLEADIVDCQEQVLDLGLEVVVDRDVFVRVKLEVLEQWPHVPAQPLEQRLKVGRGGHYSAGRENHLLHRSARQLGQDRANFLGEQLAGISGCAGDE